jgi:hypothetical protein
MFMNMLKGGKPDACGVACIYMNLDLPVLEEAQLSHFFDRFGGERKLFLPPPLTIVPNNQLHVICTRSIKKKMGSKPGLYAI